MKKATITFAVFILFLSACSLLDAGKESEIVSEQRCGDGVCDGPENADNCPKDCTIHSGTGSETANAQNGSDNTDDQKSITSDEGPMNDIFGEVYADISVTREDGVGDCGVEPWGVDHIDGGDFTCPPPKYWYGYQLEATAQQQVNLIPQGQGWVISPRSNGGGVYQQASASSDGQRVCEPKSIKTSPFGFDVDGATADGEITLNITSNPVEITAWECDGGNAYERETTLLLIDWGVAVGGNYHDLSVLFTADDRTSESRYQKTFTADMNPSPDNRDHAQVTLTFTCMQKRDDATSLETACPW